MVLIRAWLCSASRVRQPNRRILASFRPPGDWVPAQSHAGPPRQRYPIEIRALKQRHPNHRILRTVRVTHLAKKTLRMRHKTPTHALNQLKNNGLKGHE